MSSSNTSEVPDKSPEKKRRYLSAEKKFRIYLEAQNGDKPVGELLRREGLFSTDLARIRQQVKEGALQRLSAKPGRQQGQVSAEAYETILIQDACQQFLILQSDNNWNEAQRWKVNPPADRSHKVGNQFPGTLSKRADSRHDFEHIYVWPLKLQP